MITLPITETAFPFTLTIEEEGVGGVIGKAPTVAVRDGATVDSYLDFGDGTFKTSGWATKFASMTDLGTGTYQRVLNVTTTAIAVGMFLVAEYAVDDGVDVVGVEHDVISVIAAPATATALASVQTDTDDIQARLPATLVGGRMRSQVEGIDANAITAASIATGAITASEAPALANLDVAVSTRSVPGDAMDLVVDAVDASALATSAVSEIQSGLATSAGLSAIALAVAAVQADTDDLQTRLPATLTGSGRIRAQVEGVDANAIDASAIAAGAIGASEAPALANLDVAVSTRSAPGDAMDLVANAVDAAALATDAVAEVQAGLATSAQVATRAAPGDPMDLVSDAVRAATVAPSAGSEIATAVDSTLTGSHGAGAWGAAGGGVSPADKAEIASLAADAVWDEVAASHVTAGTMGEKASRLDVDVSTRAAPGAAMALTAPERAAVVDATWDEPAADHVAAGSMGARQALLDVAISTRLASGSYTAPDNATATLIRKILTNRLEEASGNPGTLVVYDDDDATPLLTWTILDQFGNGIAAQVGAPARRSKGA